MGITAVGAAVLNAIASGEGILPPERRWLLTGSIAGHSWRQDVAALPHRASGK